MKGARKKRDETQIEKKESSEEGRNDGIWTEGIRKKMKIANK